MDPSPSQSAPSDTVPPKTKRKHERGATWNIRFQASLHAGHAQPSLQGNTDATKWPDSANGTPAQAPDSRTLFVRLRTLVQQCQYVADQGLTRLQEEQHSTSHLRLQIELQRVRDDLSAAMRGWAVDKEAIIKLQGELLEARRQAAQSQQETAKLGSLLQTQQSELKQRVEENAKEVERRRGLHVKLDAAQVSIGAGKKEMSEAWRQAQLEKELSTLLRGESDKYKHAYETTARDLSSLRELASRLAVQNQDLGETVGRQSQELGLIHQAGAQEKLQTAQETVLQLQAELQELRAAVEGRKRRSLERQRLFLELQTEQKVTEKRVSDLERRATLSERQLAMFHFGVKVLDSYFLMILREHMIPRIPPSKKRKRGEHDLWDVQKAVKALLDKCEDYVNSIRDQFDFYEEEDLVGACPLCHGEHG